MKAYIDKCHPSHDQRRFTYLRRDRVVVEDAYGPLKGRWWCLSRRNDCEISDLPELITACCILHKGPQVPHVELPLVQLFFSTQETMFCFFPCGREWNFQKLLHHVLFQAIQGKCQWISTDDQPFLATFCGWSTRSAWKSPGDNGNVSPVHHTSTLLNPHLCSKPWITSLSESPVASYPGSSPTENGERAWKIWSRAPWHTMCGFMCGFDNWIIAHAVCT